MHRNTSIFIALLAVISAFLIGVNLNNRLHPDKNSSVQPLASSVQLPNASPTNYTLTSCGISFAYPESFTKTESTDSVQLVDNETSEKISIGCAKEVPKIPLTNDKIEDATVSGQKAKLYHDKSSKDGTPTDVVIFTHPKNNLQIAIFGYGKNFDELVKGVKLTP